VAGGADGGAELWAGYEHYIGFKIAQWYNAAPAALRESVIEPLARLLPSSAGYINPRLAVATFLRAAHAPAWQRVQTMLTAFTPDMQDAILDDSFKAQCPGFLAPEALFAPTREHYDHWQPQNAAAPLARAFHVYARQFMLDDILVKVDRCSMLHSLEVRAPFLDKDAAEFAARLPVSRKLHGFKRKWLLKKAFADLLPKEILHRNKRGFQIPVAQWLRGRLRPLMEDLLCESALKAQGIFNPLTVRALMDRHISGQADLRKPLWTLLVFQLWWRARHNWQPLPAPPQCLYYWHCGGNPPTSPACEETAWPVRSRPRFCLPCFPASSLCLAACWAGARALYSPLAWPCSWTWAAIGIRTKSCFPCTVRENSRRRKPPICTRLLKSSPQTRAFPSRASAWCPKKRPMPLPRGATPSTPWLRWQKASCVCFPRKNCAACWPMKWATSSTEIFLSRQ